MKQHIISRWLLRAFARPDRGDDVLVQYDKATDDYRETTPDGFLVEVDAHSPEIERGIGAIETPAAQAARRLAKRVRSLRPGFYALVDEDSEVRATGDQVADIGVVEGMRMFMSQFVMPSPNQADRLALATYIGLMYQRAPKVEASMIRWGKEYDEAAQLALNRLLPGMRTGLTTELARRRSRMLSSAQTIGTRLAEANWWVVRPPDGENYVLSDCPVAATLALGHDDTWRAILSSESYVVVMPIGPRVALVIAPQRVIPVSNIEPEDLTDTINRLAWRSADRYVLGGDRAILDAALPGADAALRRSTVDVDYDAPRVAAEATAQVEQIVVEAVRLRLNNQLRLAEEPWQRWDGCRLVFGHEPPLT